MSPWLGRRWYDTVFWSSFLGFTFGNSLRVIGRRNMPESGPVLVVANHQSMLDPVLVGLASRRYLSYLARVSLFHNRFAKAIIESLDAIPIDNKGFSKDGVKATLDVLHRGKAILVFPEGERTHDGSIIPFKPGVSLLVKKVECPIVPVGIVGAFEALSRSARLPAFAPLFLRSGAATIALSIGKPILPGELKGMNRDEMMKHLHTAVVAEYQRAQRIRRQPRGGRSVPFRDMHPAIGA